MLLKIKNSNLTTDEDINNDNDNLSRVNKKSKRISTPIKQKKALDLDNNEQRNIKATTNVDIISDSDCLYCYDDRSITYCLWCGCRVREHILYAITYIFNIFIYTCIYFLEV